MASLRSNGTAQHRRAGMGRLVVAGYIALLVSLLVGGLRPTGVAHAAAAVPDDQFLSAGEGHTCALSSAGAADCWGDNDYGQAEDQAGPYIAISAGDKYTCALSSAGAVDCWGDNQDGQASDQAGPYSSVSAAYYHTCALTPVGAVDCWGDEPDGKGADQPGPYNAVSVGLHHTCALTRTGAADCWGDNIFGEATDQPGPYVAISAGFNHTCAVTTTGVVDCWGRNTDGQAEDQAGPYTAISAGKYHTCALTTTGAVDCWGWNFEGMTTGQDGPYHAISAGSFHTCALTDIGAADCWGSNKHGEAQDQAGPYGPYRPPTPTQTPSPTTTPEPTMTPVPTPVPTTPAPTSTPEPTSTSAPTSTPMPTNTPTTTPVPPVAFPANGVLDSFNRANGAAGTNWEGLAESTFYRIAANRLDVQVGGPLVWKATSYGTAQEAFVTLSTIDGRSPSQGVLLKVQTGSIPDAGAIAVVYDAPAKVVRISTLRLGAKTWTLYAAQAATFASGDQLGARVGSDGTVTIYRNGTKLVAGKLSAADQTFFNTKGGKIGIWTAAAPNAVLDDFGGGSATP